MGTIFSQSDSLKKAVQWISEQLKSEKKQNKTKVINEAAFRFDLSPKDSDFLYNFYQNEKNK